MAVLREEDITFVQYSKERLYIVMSDIMYLKYGKKPNAPGNGCVIRRAAEAVLGEQSSQGAFQGGVILVPVSGRRNADGCSLGDGDEILHGAAVLAWRLRPANAQQHNVGYVARDGSSGTKKR